jgi:protoheme IX farnesyltransferase
MIRNYWLVTKPGIIFGNLFSVAGGFFLASKGRVDIALMLLTSIGITLVIASSCVLNNCIDKTMDRLMARTRDRVLANGLMSPKAAVIYALVLGTAGMGLLLTATNVLTVVIVLSGFGVYVGVYSLYLKRYSRYAPIIGSLAGAAPPLAGYCAVSNAFDMGAVILFSIFSLWQMPHFYAIAIYRLQDYAAAAIPVLPIKRGILAAQKHITRYIVAFIVATLLLTLAGYTGYRYFAVALVLGLVWLFLAWSGFKTTDDKRWARKLFACSIVTIFSLSIMMSVDFASPPTPTVLTPVSYTAQRDCSPNCSVGGTPVSFNPGIVGLSPEQH